MPALLDMLSQQLRPNTVRMISDKVGADEATTVRAIRASMPVLLGALAHNANQSQSSAQTLAKALDRDHDGSLLDNLDEVLSRTARGGGMMGDAGSGVPNGISVDRQTVATGEMLQHIFGARRSEVELGISRASGMDVRKISQLLEVLAPIVLGALGRVKRDQGLNHDQIASLLNKERATVERETSGTERGDLIRFLDIDDEGQVADEVADIGDRLVKSNAMNRLFGERLSS